MTTAVDRVGGEVVAVDIAGAAGRAVDGVVPRHGGDADAFVGVAAVEADAAAVDRLAVGAAADDLDAVAGVAADDVAVVVATGNVAGHHVAAVDVALQGAAGRGAAGVVRGDAEGDMSPTRPGDRLRRLPGFVGPRAALIPGVQTTSSETEVFRLPKLGAGIGLGGGGGRSLLSPARSLTACGDGRKSST